MTASASLVIRILKTDREPFAKCNDKGRMNMENFDNQLKPNDTSKYNLRCNRNISEKMTKKDFVYDIPAPFQAIRRDKYLAHLSHGNGTKKQRDNYGCLITSNGVKTTIRNDEKLAKNSVGVLRLIQPHNLTDGTISTSKISTLRQSSVDNGRPIVFKHLNKVDETEEVEIRRQIVLPIQLRRKIGSESKSSRYAVISTDEKNEFENPSDGVHNTTYQLPERKILDYECNYCHERVATLLSLSTHVKYHCEIHCSICYWIPQRDESMTQHLQRAHPVNISTHVPISDHP